MRSTGISAYRIALMSLPTILVVALLQLAVGMVVAPHRRPAGEW